MLNIDLTGRRALVAGVADDGGFGFAIAKSLAEAGASVCVATWPPALNIFLNLLERGKMDESRKMPDGSMLAFEKIYPLDAAFDTLADVPDDLMESKRYKDLGDFSIDGLVRSADHRLRRVVAGHRDPLARERAGGEEAAPRHDPGGVPRRRQCERLLPREHGAPARTADATRGRRSFRSRTWRASA